MAPPGEPNFIKQLVYFDKDNISDKVLKKISAYCSQPDFQPDIIGRVSVAAKSLCMWVRAMEVRRGAECRRASLCHGWARGWLAEFPPLLRLPRCTGAFTEWWSPSVLA